MQELATPDQRQIPLNYDHKEQLIQFTDPCQNTTTQYKDDFGQIVYSHHLASAAGWSNPKTALLKLTTGVNVVQTAAQAVMAAYLVHEFGQAAGAIFNDLLEKSDQINALDDLDLCERSQAIQKIQDALVETMGTFLQEASPGVLKKMLGTVNLKKKKDNNNEECKSKPYNANNLKSCYENKGEWSGISGQQPQALETTIEGPKTTIQECKPK